MQTVQLALSDAAYLAAVRAALCHSCAWHVESVEHPDASQHCVLVLDEQAFERLPLPLTNPERVVLITRTETHQLMAQAWEAGIVSVLSANDPLDTVLLAIMAAALRVAKCHSVAVSSEISPSSGSGAAPNAPLHRSAGPKRDKFQ